MEEGQVGRTWNRPTLGGSLMSAMNEDQDEKPYDPGAIVRANWARLEVRFAEAAAEGYRWLAECRDLSDAFDSDAGVFYVKCADDEAVDQVVARCPEIPVSSYSEVLLGVFDLRRPFNEQIPGLKRSEW